MMKAALIIVVLFSVVLSVLSIPGGWTTVPESQLNREDVLEAANVCQTPFPPRKNTQLI